MLWNIILYWIKIRYRRMDKVYIIYVLYITDLKSEE